MAGMLYLTINGNGQTAYLALWAHYVGAFFHDLIKSKANPMISKTFYRGDTQKFNWEEFVTIHLAAHCVIQDVGEPSTESIKILNFKWGIRPEVGLESTLDVARGLTNVNKTFDSFSDYITEGGTSWISRRELL